MFEEWYRDECTDVTMYSLLYYLFPHRFRYLLLLVASYYFYMCWNPQYALLMALSTLITYLSGLALGAVHKSEATATTLP